MTTDRQTWMTVLARAPVADLAAAELLLPSYTLVRGPELGLVLLRGRAGGTGGAFNVGEATLARCTVRSDAGYVGHAYCLGRDLRQAELAAALDAAMQDPARAPLIDASVITPLAHAQAEKRRAVAERAAATQVQFFTLATMRS